MDRQAAFDKAVTFLRAQGCRATVKADPGTLADTRCMLRTPDGRKCAIGALIPDEEYHTKMDDNGGVRDMLDAYPTLRSVLDIQNDEDVFFLSALQQAHDGAKDFKIDFEPAAKRVARDYNLNYKEA